MHLSFSVNKRLDEWVPEERMDVSKMEFARKDIKTPKKEPGKLNAGSRPGSPERDHTLMVYKLFIWFLIFSNCTQG